MKKETKQAKKAGQAKTDETPAPQLIPQWVVQPYLYQALLLQWFETLHEGLKEIHSVLEKIEAKIAED